MKTHHYILIFLCVLTVLVTRLDERQMMLSKVISEKARITDALERASYDGASQLVIKDAGDRPYAAKEQAVEQFFHSLYVGFGINGDKIREEEIRSYIPLIMIMEQDGFSFYYRQDWKEKTEEEHWGWSRKYPYATCITGNGHRKYYCSVTLGTTVSICLEGENRIWCETYKDAYFRWNELKELASYESFESFRENTILQSITEKMEEYIHIANERGKRNGNHYGFFVPDYFLENGGELSDNNGKINDKGTFKEEAMVVLFQGYPIGNSATGVFNQVYISGAGIRKR